MMQMMMVQGRCVVCDRDKDRGYEQLAGGQPVVLFGGYVSSLCDGCRNAWHEHCAANPRFRRLDEVSNELDAIKIRAASKNRSNEEADELAKQFLDLCAEGDGIEREGFAVARDWLAARVKAAAAEGGE